MRIISWNCRRASASSQAWDYLRELDPHVALLQEVTGLPDDVRARWSAVSRVPTGRAGKLQPFSTVVLVAGTVERDLTLESDLHWVQSELDRFDGNLVGCAIRTHQGEAINVVSVYSPAWPVDRSRLIGIDTSGVQLRLNRDVWLADILLAALPAADGSQWVVGGDFNLSETFDDKPGGPRGNREYLDRIADRGFTECLRTTTGQLTPTFRNPKGGAIIHQMDHLFATRALADRLIRCSVGSAERVFGLGLSDHLPIVAEFRDADVA